jgi:hypothetical protein
MAKGQRSEEHPNRKVHRERWEVQPVTQTGSERTNYALVGHGPNLPAEHGQRRFGTHAEALGYMEKRGLRHR